MHSALELAFIGLIVVIFIALASVLVAGAVLLWKMVLRDK